MSIHNKEETEAVLDMAAAYKEIIEAKDRLIEQLREDKTALMQRRNWLEKKIGYLTNIMELTGWDKGRPW